MSDWVHGVEERAQEVSEGALNDSFDGVDCILSKSSGFNKLMMKVVDVLHEEGVMEHEMSEPEPSIKAEHVNYYIQQEFLHTIIMGRIVSIIRHVLFNLPEKKSSQCDHKEKSPQTH